MDSLRRGFPHISEYNERSGAVEVFELTALSLSVIETPSCF